MYDYLQYSAFKFVLFACALHAILYVYVLWERNATVGYLDNISHSSRFETKDNREKRWEHSRIEALKWQTHQAKTERERVTMTKYLKYIHEQQTHTHTQKERIALELNEKDIYEAQERSMILCWWHYIQLTAYTHECIQQHIKLSHTRKLHTHMNTINIYQRVNRHRFSSSFCQ